MRGIARPSPFGRTFRFGPKNTEPFGVGAAYKRTVTFDNVGGGPKAQWAAPLDLTNANFDFAHAASDGSDVAFSDGTDTYPLGYWVESWDAGAQVARLWVRLPSVVAGGTTSVIMRYGLGISGSSDIAAPMLYGDDFQRAAHPTLTDRGGVLTVSQAWEGSAPHSMSVVDWGSVAASPNAYRYWGYYGVQAGGTGVGIAWSNDLLAWTKDPANPYVVGVGMRWPTVIKLGGTLHMTLTVAYQDAANQRIDHYTSGDGTTWAFAETTVPNGTYLPGNPWLMKDSATNKIVLLYYRHTSATRWGIWLREADSVGALATAPDELLLEADFTLAAPSMVYFGGEYWLYLEAQDGAGTGFWRTIALRAPTPRGGFKELTNSALLGNATDQVACPCPFVSAAGDLYLFTCYEASAVWSLRLWTAAAAAGTPAIPPVQTFFPWRNLQADAYTEADDSAGLPVLDFTNPTAVGDKFSQLQTRTIQDFVWRASIKRVTGSYVHGAFRRSPDTGYRFWISDTQYEIDTDSNLGSGGTAVIASGTHAAWTAGYNDVIVRCVGTTIDLIVNGVTLASVVDATYNQAGFVILEIVQSSDYVIDWATLRPYDGTDPSASISGETFA